MFFVISQKAEFNNKNINISNFNPFQGTYIEEYTPRTGEKFFIYKNEIELNSPIISSEKTLISKNIIPAISIKQIEEEIDSTYNEPVEYSEEKNYHVIAGCFSIKENAEGLVKQWIEKGTESCIVDKKGKLYRVALQKFFNKKKSKRISKKNQERIRYFSLDFKEMNT